MSTSAPQDFLIAACAPGSRDPQPAIELRRKHADALAQDFAAAIAAGLVDSVEAHLARGGEAAATAPLAPFDWPPLLYACRSVLAAKGVEHAGALVETAKRLLQAGAESNTLFPARPGEQDAPRAPILFAAAALHANVELTRLLLEAGADAAGFGETLIQSAFRDAWDCFDALLGAGAKIDDTVGLDGLPSLHAVVDRAAAPMRIQHLLNRGADPDLAAGPIAETPLLIAVRRRRPAVVGQLLDLGARIDARTQGGKTGYAHAARRGFSEVADHLAQRGADRSLTPADRMAVALSKEDLTEAQAILADYPEAAASRNPEEARIAADLAGRPVPELLAWLLDAGGDPEARGLDGGTPLHQAAWFGQPACARLLIERGADLTVRCTAHGSTPVGWVAHGSLFSGDAERRVDAYVEIAEALVRAGAPVPPDVPAAAAVAQVLHGR